MPPLSKLESQGQNSDTDQQLLMHQQQQQPQSKTQQLSQKQLRYQFKCKKNYEIVKVYLRLVMSFLYNNIISKKFVLHTHEQLILLIISYFLTIDRGLFHLHIMSSFCASSTVLYNGSSEQRPSVNNSHNFWDLSLYSSLTGSFL